MSATPRVVCVLSGGGAKAGAHVGALRALDEWRLAPAHFVGTSLGAVVGACFASALSYDDILRRITTLGVGDIAWPSARLALGPWSGSLLSGPRFRETIAALVPARTFAELATPLTVTAVDRSSGQLVLFGAGGRDRVPLVDALYASCALPIYYPPARIGDRQYVDGGLRAVLPLAVARQFAPDLVFAVNVGASFFSEPPARRGAPPLLAAHDDAMRILMAGQIEAAVGRWPAGSAPLILVQPHTARQATFAVHQVAQYVEEGYRSAYRALAERSGAGAE